MLPLQSPARSFRPLAVEGCCDVDGLLQRLVYNMLRPYHHTCVSTDVQCTKVAIVKDSAVVYFGPYGEELLQLHCVSFLFGPVSPGMRFMPDV